MRNINKLIFALGLVFLCFSCGDDLTDLNNNPNQAPSANPEEVLTSTIGYLAWVVDARYNRHSFVWAQYWTWGPGVAIGDIERYKSAGADFDNEWIRLYSGALENIKFIKSTDSRSHVGAAKILEAYIMQGLVDHFGDVPYSEALRGSLEDGSIFSPIFDDQKVIYNQLLPLIDDGIADLSAGKGLGPEDLVNGGSTDLWMKFGRSLKLRILMRQSEVADHSLAISNLVANGGFIESASDMIDIAFAGQTGDENPMYARMEAGVKNFWIASNTCVTFMQSLNDPRLNLMYPPAVNSGALTSIPQGSIEDQPMDASTGDYSQMPSFMYAADNPVILMSPWEVWFLRAEAAVRYNTADNANSSFEAAVASHFDYIGAGAPTDYLSALNFAGSSNKVNMIATQKWISMNGLQDDEGWIETRRFDTSGNQLFTDDTFERPAISVMTGKERPSIWLYPANELSLNGNAPAQRNLKERVFWDN